jgi:hypothetical protein
MRSVKPERHACAARNPLANSRRWCLQALALSTANTFVLQRWMTVVRQFGPKARRMFR